MAKFKLPELPGGKVRKSKKVDVSETQSAFVEEDKVNILEKEKVKVKDKMKGFVHLHFHTEYSNLYAVGRIDEMIKNCAIHGCKTLAVTDYNTTSSWYSFNKECGSYGIKPIFGVEIDVCNGDVNNKGVELDRRKLVLLARNQEGYRNLLKLVTIAWKYCSNEKPRVNYEYLSECSGGVTCLTGSIDGILSAEILNGTGREIDIVKKLIKFYGKKNVYIELTALEIDEQIKCNMRLLELSQFFKLKIILANDVHYVDKNQAKYQDALMAIREKRSLDDMEALSTRTDRYRTRHAYFKGRKEIYKSFKTFNPNISDLIVKKAIKNAISLADSINVKLEKFENLLPTLDPPKGYKTNGDYLRYLVNKTDLALYIDKTRVLWKNKLKTLKIKENIEKLKERIENIEQEYKDRIDYELNMIIDKGYADYFVIIWDIYQFANSQGIASGAGRGSVAGCLIGLSLGIHWVDPIFYGLIFERFISEYRHDLPDIDMDFQDTRRMEVKKYIEEKYGTDCVASITNFGKLKERAILDDLARIMRISRQVVDRVKANLITRSSGDARQGRILRDSIEIFDELKQIRDVYPRFFEYAETLEGQNRGTGVHAAGVVVTPEPLHRYLSVEDRDGVKVTSYSGKDVESLGLAKLDLLGLKNLDEINIAEEYIGKHIHWRDINYEDKDVLELFKTGNTVGLFQFECVPEDMLVSTENGYIKIEDLYKTAEEFGDCDGENEVQQFNRNVKRSKEKVFGLKKPGVDNRPISTNPLVFNVGEKECFEVVTEDGQVIETTMDELLFTSDGKESRLRDLNIGDEIVVYE